MFSRLLEGARLSVAPGAVSADSALPQATAWSQPRAAQAVFWLAMERSITDVTPPAVPT